MRTLLRGRYSYCKEVASALSQGSVLAPIMFLVNINDIKDSVGTESYMNMFADDAKIQKKIATENSCLELQNYLTTLYEWQMEFNAEKCHIIKFGKSRMRPDWEFALENYKLQESEKEKELGVVIINRLTRRSYKGKSKEYA